MSLGSHRLKYYISVLLVCLICLLRLGLPGKAWLFHVYICPLLIQKWVPGRPPKGKDQAEALQTVRWKLKLQFRP